MTGKRQLVLWLACLLPLAAILAVTVFKAPIGAVALFALVLLCPLSHLFLMKDMHGPSQTAGAATQTETNKQKPSCH